MVAEKQEDIFAKKQHTKAKEAVENFAPATSLRAKDVGALDVNKQIKREEGLKAVEKKRMKRLMEIEEDRKSRVGLLAEKINEKNVALESGIVDDERDRVQGEKKKLEETLFDLNKERELVVSGALVAKSGELPAGSAVKELVESGKVVKGSNDGLKWEESPKTLFALASKKTGKAGDLAKRDGAGALVTKGAGALVERREYVKDPGASGDDMFKTVNEKWKKTEQKRVGQEKGTGALVKKDEADSLVGQEPKRESVKTAYALTSKKTGYKSKFGVKEGETGDLTRTDEVGETRQIESKSLVGREGVRDSDMSPDEAFKMVDEKWEKNRNKKRIGHEKGAGALVRKEKAGALKEKKPEVRELEEQIEWIKIRIRIIITMMEIREMEDGGRKEEALKKLENMKQEQKMIEVQKEAGPKSDRRQKR